MKPSQGHFYYNYYWTGVPQAGFGWAAYPPATGYQATYGQANTQPLPAATPTPLSQTEARRAPLTPGQRKRLLAGRKTLTTVEGARIEYSPGSEAEAAKAARVCQALAVAPSFRSVIPKCNIRISPPGQGIEVFPGFESADLAEGWAEGTAKGRYTCMIRNDSLQRWNLGLTHELIHIRRCFMERSFDTEMKAARMGLGGTFRDPLTNAEEMLALFGQYYAAGFGAAVQRQAGPGVFNLCRRALGEARVDPGMPLSEAEAEARIGGLVRWFQQ